MRDHPSHLALDRARLGDRPAEIEAHLAECDRCRAIVATGRPPIPAWVRRLEVQTPWFRRPFVIPAVGVALAAVAAFVWLPTTDRLQPEVPYVGTKDATPAISVFVRRGEAVDQWSGDSVRVGDRLQLRLTPGGFGWVTVVVPVDGAFAVLHQERIVNRDAGSPFLLSRSFEVDDSPGDTVLIVMLSHEQPSADVVANPPARAEAKLWVDRIRFRQEGAL